VLKPLVSAGFLRSLKGPSGGYRLARPAGKISVLEVIEAVDGPLRGQAPLPAEPVAVREDLDARLTAVCDKAAAAVRKHLSKVTISDLISDEPVE
jgi:Rrf2 family protein